MLGFGRNGGSFRQLDAGAPSETTNTSFLGGGQVGVNYEFGGGVVVGAEAMFDWLPNTKNTINSTHTAPIPPHANINNRWLTTATGKLGYAWDRVLLYGKGGGAWVGTSNIIRLNHGQRSACFTISRATTLAGPLVSASNGLSRATGQRGPSGIISGYKSELYGRCRDTGMPADVISVNNRSINMFTAGLNYKFGGGWW